MSKLDQIVEDLSALTVIEASELAKLLEDKWGVSAAAPMVQAVAGGADDGEAAAAEEQTEFTVTLKAAGEKKISTIKAVREIFGLGLKEAKDVVDAAPKALKEGVGKQEAESIRKKLEEAGAEVEIS